MAANEHVHVHLVNDPELPELFRMHEEQFWGAFDGAPELRERIRLTVGDEDDGLLEAAETADVLVGWRFRHHELAPHAPRLRWIHVIGAGVEHLAPIDWLPEGAVLTNSSGVHVQRAGEFIACALLMLQSRIPRHVTSQRRHEWAPAYSDTIGGKAVVFVGVGSIGGEGARWAGQLGLEVRGVRRSGRPHEHVDRMYGADDLHEALAGAHFAVITAPSTPETRGLIGGAELDLLAPGAGVVNIARAAIMDEEALAARLADGSLGGAILDVFDPEPLPPSSPLWDCENLLVTPHVSSDPADYNARMFAMFAANFARFEAGEPLHNRVDEGY